jgi:hypothetical protein
MSTRAASRSILIRSYGWRPIVYTRGGHASDLQQRAELAAKELRGLFDLKDKD